MLIPAVLGDTATAFADLPVVSSLEDDTQPGRGTSSPNLG